MRWRLRLLFLGLMAVGVLWIHLDNYVLYGTKPLDDLVRRPAVVMTVWGGALALGLLLDAMAGYYLRPFYRALQKVRSGDPPPPRAAAMAASRAIHFPVRASMLLLGLSAGLILLHRLVLYSDDFLHHLLFPAERVPLLSSMLRDFVRALALSLLLMTLGQRILRGAIAAFGLREVPGEERLPIGLRLSLVVIILGTFQMSIFATAPRNVPSERWGWAYLPAILMIALISYLLATDIGHDLKAVAGRLRVLAAGVRPDLFERFAVTEQDEVGDLVAAINVLQDRVEREFRTIQRDLEAARTMQTGMLPRSFPLPPGWQAAARLIPAQEVGGDFYDLIDLGAGRFGVAVGDAAGKGLPAALLMASTVSLIRSHAPLHRGPGAVLEAVNRLLSSSLPPTVFVTAVYAVVDPVHRLVTVASAGHMPPVIAGQEAEAVPALPLGVDPDTHYEERTYELGPGTPILFFSDGLLEATNPAGRLLDWGQVAGLLRQAAGGAEAMLDSLMQRVAAHTGHTPLADDVTALILISPPEVRLALPSRYGSELIAAEHAARFAQQNGISAWADDVATAVGEACLNAITHGNGLREAIPVEVCFLAGQGWVEVTVKDSGPLFTPPAGPPDLQAQMAGDGPIRGWGWHLIRSLATELHIESLATGKQVRLRFGGDVGV